MTIKSLQNEMVKAMKEGDKARKNVISGLIAAVKKVAIDEGVRDNIPEELVDKVIMKELKTAKEQVTTCPPDRTELIAEYTYNQSVIEEFAPKMLSEEEIEQIIMKDFADIIAGKNKGLAMKTIMPAFKGKADGKIVSNIVNNLLK